LLYEAAEIEHNLVCTYLCAAFSLKDRESEGLDSEEAEAEKRWRYALVVRGNLQIISGTGRVIARQNAAACAAAGTRIPSRFTTTPTKKSASAPLEKGALQATALRRGNFQFGRTQWQV